ncbi:MAG: molybdopterin converting factor, subunit 1 [Solirubrobacterales bacterium]|nr:molybdopterin converting factor, subunit 1 [Solirubrobacterales bacterium]
MNVRLFAVLRQRAGTGAIELELPDDARVRDALDALGTLTDGVPCVLAVNREYAPDEHVLRAGDELALIPPVSGGSGGGAGGPVRHVRITEEPLSLDALACLVASPLAGAVVTFSGVTREVAWLDYECYVEMATPMLQELVDAAIARHSLTAAAVEHRVGRVPLGEPSVIVATSSGHRPEAFAAARELIDELKARAPIWKAEEGEWVVGEVPPIA